MFEGRSHAKEGADRPFFVRPQAFKSKRPAGVPEISRRCQGKVGEERRGGGGTMRSYFPPVVIVRRFPPLTVAKFGKFGKFVRNPVLLRLAEVSLLARS